MQINELITTHFSEEQLKASHGSELLTKLLDYWANEKDYELDLELLKQLILRYAALERELVALNQLKNKFLGLAAHDLRNPLISIRGLAELLFSDDSQPLTEMQREFLTTIHCASDGMLTLVNDILDMAAIESGKLRLQIRRRELRPLLEERIRVNRVVAKTKRIEIQHDLAEIPPLPFDWNRITQVVDNLIGNAIKFSPHDSDVRICLSRQNGTAVVTVQDWGPGLSEADQSLLFQEFKPLSNGPTGGEKSTGLGLSIAKQIIEEHRGSLHLHSEIGVGTTFCFTLPMED